MPSSTRILPKPPRVLIVDDHPFVGESLRELLDDEMGVDDCTVARSAEEALDRLDGSRPQLALIDVSLPRMDGISLVREVRARRPDLPCLMLSGHGDPSFARRALDAGARGYVLKGEAIEIFSAIEKVLAGDVYVSRKVRGAFAKAPAGD